MYFFVHMSNFILQNFEELDCEVRKSIILSKTQKMSKMEQRKKIALVSQQISDLKDRVAKLESCLCTLEQDPDQYFQNLNPNNREYVEWKKILLPSEKRQENKSSTEEKKRIVVLLPPAVVGRRISVFFCIDWAFSHCCFNNADLGIIMILFFIWTHCPWVLLFIHTCFRGQCVLSFSGGIIFFTSPSFTVFICIFCSPSTLSFPSSSSCPCTYTCTHPLHWLPLCRLC